MEHSTDRYGTSFRFGGQQNYPPFVNTHSLQESLIYAPFKHERAVPELIGKVMTNPELAAKFGIMTNISKIHLPKFHDKLLVKNGTQAIAGHYGPLVPDRFALQDK